MEFILEIIREVFEVEDIKRTKRGIFFVGNFLVDIKHGMSYIRNNLKPLGYLPTFSRDNSKIEIGFLPLTSYKKIDFKIPVLLFLATVLTTLFAGAVQQGANPFKNPYSLIKGIPFSFTLMSILLFHEMGHFLTSRKFGVYATPPYFLPVPHPLIGTFGAFIKMKSPVPNKKALLYIGGAGPVLGFLVALPLACIGLSLSTPVSVETAKGLFLGESIVFKLLSLMFAPQIGNGQDLVLHPMAFASWLGIFVTALNLIPLSQLDGGHISYALFGKKSKFIAIAVIPILFFLGTFWPGWFLWAIFPIFLGIEHPSPLDGLTPLEKKDKIIAFIFFIIFILSFIPVPFSFKGI